MAQAKKKKKFFDVDAQLIDGKIPLLAYEIEDLDGRIIRYDMTRLLKGKSLILQLKVSVNGEKAEAVPIETNLLPYFLKRMVRKGTNYVEDSFTAECENARIRIKPFLITRRKVPKAVRKALRNKAREEIIEYVKGKKSEDLFDEIIKNTWQKSLSLKLKKIYPLSLCEIRVLKIEKGK